MLFFYFSKYHLMVWLFFKEIKIMCPYFKWNQGEVRTGYLWNVNGFSALRVGIWGLAGKIQTPETATISSKHFLKVTAEKLHPWVNPAHFFLILQSAFQR